MSRNPLPPSPPLATHLIGACGSGMKALAELLVDRGCRVTGSDQSTDSPVAESLRYLGISLSSGHRAEQVPVDCGRVISSPAVPFENVERQRAREGGLSDLLLPDVLGDLTREQPSVCIAGTHGKSTTTAMIGWMLTRAGRTTSVYCGAEVIGIGRSGWCSPIREATSAQGAFVVESCEFRRHFLKLHPQTAVLLGIEWDHVDCFASLDETIDAFAEFVTRVPEDGLIVSNADCPATAEALHRAARLGASPRRLSFGTSSGADVRVQSTADGLGSQLQLTGMANDGSSSNFSPCRLNLPGKHNALSAAACVAVGQALGLAPEEIVSGLTTFPGVRRRLQRLGDWGGMTLIDDYAHHPTAVRAGIETLRNAFPQRPIRVVFQPHQVRRTEAFLAPFADALAGADHVAILPAYGAREASPDSSTVSDRLAEAVRKSPERRAVTIRRLESLDHVAASLQTDGRPGDVVVLMGAGSIERIADEFSGRLRRHHAG